MQKHRAMRHVKNAGNNEISGLNAPGLKIICSILKSQERIIYKLPVYPSYEVIGMEKEAQKKSNEQFNSITQKMKPENQNQTHNVRKEGTTPINQKR